MTGVDLNRLAALDALLSEGSVTGAARRLGLSSSAMSRTLARLRSATGDPLLGRAARLEAVRPGADGRPPPARGGDRTQFTRDQARSNRSRFITLVHAATKSRTNFSCESSHA